MWLLAFLTEAYDEEVLTDSKGKEDVRTVLRLHPALAPFKAAVLPLAKKLAPVAEPIYEELAKHFISRLRCHRLYRQEIQKRGRDRNTVLAYAWTLIQRQTVASL